jgi:YbbR domain-containing protein
MAQQMWNTIQERVTSSQLARFGLSLLIALFLWGWVTMLEDPVETQRYAEIAISTPELPGALQIVTALPRATVIITDVSSELDQLTRTDITVSLDTSEVDGPGFYQLDVIAGTDRNMREVKVSPDTVSVEIEEVISRNFPLRVETQQPADDSRRVLDINPEVSEVTVTGTRSAVDRVDRVVLPVTIDTQTTDFVDMIQPKAVDKNNQPIPEVTIDPAHVRTEVVLEKRGKTVSVVPQVTGTPAEGFVVQQQVAVPATVIVDGPENLLDDLLFISTAPVDITGATQSVSQTVPLVGLPDGVTLVEPAQNEVEVRVAISSSGGQANLIPDMPITVVNLRDGLTARLDPSTIDISLSAPATLLSELTANDIAVTVDVAGLGPGVYTLTPTIDVPDDVTVTNADPQRVVVLIGDQSATPAAGASPEALDNQ